MNGYWLLVIPGLFIAGCANTPPQVGAGGTADEQRISVAAAQREIRVGLSGAEVLEVLGSPNIISTDSERREVWIYDRVSTDEEQADSHAGIGGLLGAVGGSVAGMVLPSYHQDNHIRRTSQRTLTVIIYFDGDRRVRDYTYHASRF